MGSISLNPWPFGHTAAFVIRDDDISYFTPPHKIDEIYEKLWKNGFKVSLAVIPCVKAINSLYVPPQYRGKISEYSVHDNKELINYLKIKLADGKVDIAQHGYNHDIRHGVPEFCISDSSEIWNRLKLGQNILERSLPSKLRVFVPPYGRISKQAWGILKQEGFALCRKGNIYGLIKNILWYPDNMTIFLKILQAKIFSLQSNSLAKGFLKFPGIIEIYHSLNLWKRESFFECLKDAKREFKKTLMACGLFCIVNHWWLYNEDWQDRLTCARVSKRKMLECFYDFIFSITNYNLWKTTLSEAVNWIKKYSSIEVRIKGSDIILKSPTTLEGLTLKSEGCTLTPDDECEVEVKKRGDTFFLIYKKLEAGETKIASVDSTERICYADGRAHVLIKNLL